MVRFTFSVEDLSRTRFAISPMWELVHSLLALRDPSHAAIHLPWLRSISGRLHGLALKDAAVLTPARGYTPDFLLPLPSGPLGSIAEDLESLRSTPSARIRDEMRLFASQHADGPDVAERWLANPRRELQRLADLLEAYWRRALEPVWPRVRAFLEQDIFHRARELAAGGPAALFSDLSPRVAWQQPHLDVQVPAHEATTTLDGRGLLLVPSAFAAERPFVIDRAPWHPAVIYPSRGIATLWEQAKAAPHGLARLLGSSRAAILAELAAPTSTTDLATRLTMSPGTASHHLTALRDAGLVTGSRNGRSVLYVRTPLGDALATGPAT
jgi:DNA-binding transcriptional ArsR family regulator